MQFQILHCFSNWKYKIQKNEFRFTLITSVDTSEGFRLMVDGRTDDFSQKYYFATDYRKKDPSYSYYLSTYAIKSLWLTVFNGHLIESPGLLPKPNMCILTNLIMVLTFLCLLFVNFNPCSQCWWQKGSFAAGCFVRGGH